jgi:hypothetical protein
MKNRETPSSPAGTTGPSPDDARAAAEARRVSELVRSATHHLPPEIEPAHHALYFGLLAEATGGDDVER